MGTSHAAAAPKRVGWKKVAASIRSPLRNSDTIVEQGFSVIVDVVPDNFIREPVIFAISEGTKFVSAAKDKGLEQAFQSESLQVSEKYPTVSAAHEIWKLASSKADPRTINSPFGMLAEAAFKKTFLFMMEGDPYLVQKIPTIKEADQNLVQFIEKSGKEGYVHLFTTNYLYELIQYYLHSRGTGEQNTSLFFYYSQSQKRTFSPDEIKKFKENLRLECSKRAKQIVDNLQQSNFSFELIDPTLNPRVGEMLTESIKHVLSTAEEQK